MNQTQISVVVPAHNSEKYLEKCLKAILLSDYNNYELIVVSDASNDNTVEIAKKYADKVIELKKCHNRLQVRMIGFQACRGELIVNIDSDVEIKSDTLTKISTYFRNNYQIGAMTGILTKESDADNFFSSYKNLYMNFKFLKLPPKIKFLYGSIFVLTRSALAVALQKLSESTIQTATDESELSQILITAGIEMGLTAP